MIALGISPKRRGAGFDVHGESAHSRRRRLRSSFKLLSPLRSSWFESAPSRCTKLCHSFTKDASLESTKSQDFGFSPAGRTKLECSALFFYNLGMSFETLPEQPDFLGSGLTEEQREQLPELARVALAIAEIDAEQKKEGAEVKVAGELTSAIAERAQLDPSTVKAHNRLLLQREFLNREGFSEPGSTKALQLSLNEQGSQYLQEEIAKIQP